MSKQQLEKKLGMPPGATLTALVDLAERVAPSAPWDAFAPLWLHLPWLKPGRRTFPRDVTPLNVHFFAETGGDLNHFGFLLDREMPVDDRPIVYVVPKDDEEATAIVAPNLRAFLGLVAVANGEFISRSATDAEWAAARHESYGDDAGTLAEMDRLSTLLCSIPGVERPASPSRVANACPNQLFTFPEPKAPNARRLALTTSIDAARDRVLSLASGMVNGQVLHGTQLASAKQEATAALIAALDALAAVDEKAAATRVTQWHNELWTSLQAGVSGNLDAQLGRFMRTASRI